jgi:hypothetical protein
MRRIVLASTTVLSVLLVFSIWSGSVVARDTLIYGAPVRRGDFVAGTVEYVRGRSVGIDMGFVDGVVVGQRFRVYRRVGGDLELSGVAIVGWVGRRESIVTPRTRVPIRAGDAVVIAASELVIWSESRSRGDAERFRRGVARPRQLGYDTREVQIDAVDMLETRRSNRLKLLEWSRRLTEARPPDRVLWDLTSLKFRRGEFIEKLESFGVSFRYRNREDREQASFTNLVQPIRPSALQAGQPYELPAVVEVETRESVAKTHAAPPRRTPRVIPLSRRVSQYLGRGNTR